MECIQKRYFMTIMAFIGHFIMFLIQLNLGIAIIAMTSDRITTVENKTKIIPAEFQWTSMETGIILSAFNCGSCLAFLTGLVAYKFGGATTTGISILIAGILELLSPMLFHVHLIAFIVARITLGLLEGCAINALADTFAHWSPKSERTRLVSCAFTGHMISGAINYPFSGYLALTLGWPSIFYISGVMLLIWSLIWLRVVRNYPEDDMHISDAEKNYLKSNTIPKSTLKAPVPWRRIWTSTSVYALLNEFLCASWTSSFTAVLLPLYIKDMHNVNIQSLGLMAGIPMFCGLITLPIAGYIADYLRMNVLSIGKVHRIFIFWGQLFVLIFLLVTVICGNFTVCLICFCLIRVAYSFSNASYQVISIDVAGQYASVLTSMTRTFYKLGHSLNPLILGYIVQNHSPAEWNLYFIFLSAASMYGIIIFLIFGSGETQPWAVPSRVQDNEDEESKSTQC